MVSPALAVPIQREVGEKRRTRSGNQVADQLRSERSISHSSIAVLAAVLPRPGISRSTITTSRPCRVSRSATSDPVMPPPTINASHLVFSVTLGKRSGVAPSNHGERPAWRSACSVSSWSSVLMSHLKRRHGPVRLRLPVLPVRRHVRARLVQMNVLIDMVDP